MKLFKTKREAVEALCNEIATSVTLMGDTFDEKETVEKIMGIINSALDNMAQEDKPIPHAEILANFMLGRNITFDKFVPNLGSRERFNYDNSILELLAPDIFNQENPYKLGDIVSRYTAEEFETKLSKINMATTLFLLMARSNYEKNK